jgi:hypothetical protein
LTTQPTPDSQTYKCRDDDDVDDVDDEDAESEDVETRM